MPEPMRFPHDVPLPFSEWLGDTAWLGDEADEAEAIADADEALVIPPWNPLEIVLDDGTVIFTIRGDGTAVLPNPERAASAAAIFWREVIVMARKLRIPIDVTDA